MGKQRGGKKGSEEAAAARIERRLQKLDAEIGDTGAGEPADRLAGTANQRPELTKPAKPRAEPPAIPTDFYEATVALDDLYDTWKGLESELMDYADLQAALAEHPDDPGMAPEVMHDFIDRATKAMVREMELLKSAEGSSFRAPGNNEGKAALMALKRARLKALRPNLEKSLFRILRESRPAA